MERLSKGRRKRPIPEGWATSEILSTYQPTETSEPLYPGTRTLSLNSSGDLALVGGVDGVVGVYSLPQKRVLETLKIGGPVTEAIWAGEKAVIASSTGAVKVFENGTELATFNLHAGEVTSLAVHPTGDIVASAGVDKSYVLYDLTTNSVTTQVFSDACKCFLHAVFHMDPILIFPALLSVKFHPDGHLVAAGGADGQIKIFEVRSSVAAANYAMSGPVKCLFFSENGTFLAAVVENSTSISIWDLRHSSEIKVLDTGNKIDTISWDYTGQFLLTGGPSGLTVQQYSKSSKQWSEPFRSAVPAVSVAWGAAAQSIVAANADGVVTVLAAKS